KLGNWNAQFETEEFQTCTSFSQFYQKLYLKEANLQGKSSVFIKENHTYKYYDYINSAFDNPKFIFLVRDPRDMALSWTRSPIHRGDIVRAAKIWQTDQSESIKLLKAKENIHLVKYQDLLINFEEEVKQICEFLEVDYHESMLNYHQNTYAQKDAKITHDWKNLSKPVMKNNFNKFKQHLREDQVTYIESLCHQEMSFLGYEFLYPLLEGKKFQDLEEKLLKEERHEKPEYQEVPEEERKKRVEWAVAYKNIVP
ncbi:MAG: sulfotransferase, partial [Bacteroidota bacterium]